MTRSSRYVNTKVQKTIIMERGREPEWESNREDPYFCVCGKHHMLDVGSLYARSVGSASSYM